MTTLLTSLQSGLCTSAISTDEHLVPYSDDLSRGCGAKETWKFLPPSNDTSPQSRLEHSSGQMSRFSLNHFAFLPLININKQTKGCFFYLHAMFSTTCVWRLHTCECVWVRLRWRDLGRRAPREHMVEWLLLVLLCFTCSSTSMCDFPLREKNTSDYNWTHWKFKLRRYEMLIFDFFNFYLLYLSFKNGERAPRTQAGHREGSPQ